MKKLFIWMLFLCGMLGCLTTDVSAAKIKLNTTKKTIVKGKTYTLKLKNAKKSKVKWKSSSKAVATVNSKGKVTAKKIGTANITATYKKKQYLCVVTVKGPTYTISTSTKPCSKTYSSSKDYNSSTKHYFVLRSYMEKLEKDGGGTLVLKKGTYTISNTVFVPSNVKISFKSGVKLVKGTKTTGKCRFQPSATMFQLVEPKIGNKKSVSSSQRKKGYNGVHDVTFAGNNTIIDMKGYNNGIAIVMGHNRNIVVSGITFKGMSRTNHLVELNSSQNVSIVKCTFNAGTAGTASDYQKECINIDYDYQEGFNNVWASHDKTHCDNIVITGCNILNSIRGLGSHVYSPSGYHHTNIKVTNCTFRNIEDTLIQAKSWENFEISNITYNGVLYRTAEELDQTGKLDGIYFEPEDDPYDDEYYEYYE